MYVCMYVCMYVSMYTRTHTHTRIYYLLANDEVTQISHAHPRGVHVAHAQNLVANANAVGSVSGAARNHLFH